MVGPGSTSKILRGLTLADAESPTRLTEVLDPANLCTVYVSPRIRAHKTFHLLFDHVEKLPDHIITEEVREWDYGEYEGLLSSEIKAKAGEAWNIWVDGCVLRA